MEEQSGPKALARQLRRDWPEIKYVLEKLPAVAHKLVDAVIDEDRNVVRKAQQHAAKQAQQRYLVFTGSAVLIASSLLISFSAIPLLGGAGADPAEAAGGEVSGDAGARIG